MKHLINAMKHVFFMLIAAFAAYHPNEQIQSLCLVLVTVYFVLAVPTFIAVAAIVPHLDGICNKAIYWSAASMVANRSLIADACLGSIAMMLVSTEHYALGTAAIALCALTGLIRLGVGSYFKHEPDQTEDLSTSKDQREIALA